MNLPHEASLSSYILEIWLKKNYTIAIHPKYLGATFCNIDQKTFDKLDDLKIIKFFVLYIFYWGSF
jgi:hypothetical protein